MLASGAIGIVRTATVNFLGVVHEPGAAGDWRHDPGLSGAGVLIDMLHGVYAIEALLGEPLERVSAHISAAADSRVEDQAMCRFETANRVGLVNIAWGHGAGGITVDGTSHRGRRVSVDDAWNQFQHPFLRRSSRRRWCSGGDRG